MITLAWPTESATAVGQYLYDSGVQAVVQETPDGLQVAAIDEAAATVALTSYARAGDRATYRPPLPLALRAHAGHMRDYEQAVRAGTPTTAAQREHVIADIITWIRLTEDRL